MSSSGDLIKELRAAGYDLVGVRGSHHKLRNAAGVVIIVPHPKKDLGKGLVARIRKDAGLKPIRHTSGSRHALPDCH